MIALTVDTSDSVPVSFHIGPNDVQHCKGLSTETDGSEVAGGAVRLMPVLVGPIPPGRPSAATGSYPYRDHRTVAEIWAGAPTRLPPRARGGL